MEKIQPNVYHSIRMKTESTNSRVVQQQVPLILKGISVYAEIYHLTKLIVRFYLNYVIEYL